MAKGFNRPRGMGGSQSNMLAQIQKMQEQMEVVQAQLSEETVTASAGGGAVKVTVTGDQRCTAIEIDPAILQDADVEMLQDLILSATNLALDQSREMASQRMGALTGGIPGLPF